ncbi:phosphonate C-P lyase system protein PhnL [Pseudoroseomonas globiformis]|uniref:Phosphonate C-P lyase system protein PhnL n=1 Tax=Teichococcus globiformis TaxID=2307229 RepID=A0ABV7G1U7_9PROT
MSRMISVTGLTKYFRLHLQNGTTIPVLHDVHMEVADGECIALSGPSGAGKSTLMRCLYGNYGICEGSILVHHQGNDISISDALPRTIEEVRRYTLGYVSQFLRVIPRVSTLDIVAQPMMDQGMDDAAAYQRASEFLLRLNLPRRLHNLPPATFSGGEQQRVNLARGFAASYPVLLLDEPTASLDPANRDVVLDMIEEARHSGAAIVGIFHDADVRDRVATRFIPVTPVQDALHDG